MKKVIALSFTAGALLGLVIMFGFFMDEHEEITTEGIQVETEYEYYPNNTDDSIHIYGSYEDCKAYFDRLGVENWVLSGGQNGEWVCYYKAADIKIH